MRKAQGLSMNVIIIAALAILVLIILAVLFINQTGVFNRATNDCEAGGGTCVPDRGADSCEGGIRNLVLGCDSERYVCCIDLT